MNRALLSAVLLCSLLLPARANAACGCPQITRDKIIEIAKSGVGCPYVWGGTCWDPASKGWKGADCSGYVTKCWQIPSASATTDCVPHYYTTSTFKSSATHWSTISRSELVMGDALVYNNGSAGHIVLFDKLASPGGCYEVYEARGTAYGIVHRVKCPDDSYGARRRHNLVEGPPPPPANQAPKGYLDDADCTSVRGWAQDPDAPTASINVHVYFDGPAGASGVWGYPVLANQNRSDLCQTLGSCVHGFALAIPARFRDGKPHPVRAYGIDTAGGQNPELIGGPKTITCAPGDAGPDPEPLRGDGRVYLDSEANAPPVYENPDDNRPENDRVLTGSCGCQTAAGAAPVAIALLLVLGLGLVRSRTRR